MERLNEQEVPCQIRLALVTVALAAVIAPNAASAHPESWAMADDCPKTFTQQQHERYVRRVYSRQKVSQKAQRRVYVMRTCQGSQRARRNARALTRRLRARYKLRKLTPYKCEGHGYFAVPCQIVWRESKYNCHAKNARSSAFGFYQLLDTWWGYLKRKPTCAEQHRIAARLWNGGAGASHWSLTNY